MCTGFVEHERRGIFAGRMPPSFRQLLGEVAHLMSRGPYVCTTETCVYWYVLGIE